MPDGLVVSVNGVAVSVPQGATVAVAMMMAGAPCRLSVSGQARGPLCAMGICFECRAQVDGVSHCRTCQILCTPGMRIKTNEPGY